VSRVHRIVEDGPVISVFGGKYTTYRAVAQDVLDRVFPATSCSTHRIPLPGGEEGPWERCRARFAPEIERHGAAEVERLYRRYGARLREVLALVREDPTLGKPLSPEHPETRAEVVHGLRREFVVYPADFLARRTTLRYSPGGGREAYDAVESLIRAHADVLPPDLDRARERYFADLEWEERLRQGSPVDVELVNREQRIRNGE
jgi:glycerol-3-phosphate dehydrogenase